jgi:ABC-type transport system substrate-binding protein
MAKGNFEIVVGSTPNSSDPSYSLRAYHSNSLTQYTNFGLFDPAIDAMIEKSEGTYDQNENAELVKNIQRELLKKYTTPIGFATPKYRLLFNSRLQNYDIRPVPIPKYSYATWWKA